MPNAATIQSSAVLLTFVAVIGACASGSSSAAPDGSSVLLDASVGHGMLQQCSRSTPEHITGYWLPSASDIQRLDSDIGKVRGASSRSCCLAGAHIAHPERSFRQYLGVVIGSKRLIYINAFNQRASEQLDWRHDSVVACDGGKEFWGALYDPKTRIFTAVAFNGLG